MGSPYKLAHVVLKTSKPQALMNWYVQLLDAQVAYANEMLGFISYDDEHHRMAFVADGSHERPTDAHTGLHHVAFTYEDLDGLLDNYFRLKAVRVEPFWCINHGPTTSMYYKDPDGNNVEMQVDNFATVEEVQGYIDSGKFAANPIGVEFDPEELASRYRAGESFDDLVRL